MMRPKVPLSVITSSDDAQLIDTNNPADLQSSPMTSPGSPCNSTLLGSLSIRTWSLRSPKVLLDRIRGFRHSSWRPLTPSEKLRTETMNPIFDADHSAVQATRPMRPSDDFYETAEDDEFVSFYSFFKQVKDVPLHQMIAELEATPPTSKRIRTSSIPGNSSKSLTSTSPVSAVRKAAAQMFKVT